MPSLSALSPVQIEAARELLTRRRARASILNYVNAIDVPGKPSSEDPDEEFFLPVETTVAHHHRLILEAFERTANTRHGRLMVFLPPGSAKSTYGSVVFPSRYLGQESGRKVILASYGDELAKKMGRRTRQICRSDRYNGILGCMLSPESRAADQWILTNGSEYMACGILSGITGNRAHGIIIDDPVKGREAANSETIRQKTWDAYQDDLLTRLIPGGWLAIIQTRWHQDDLAGRILPEDWKGQSGMIECRDGNTWEVLCIQAKCQDGNNDPLGREHGQYLWPEWFDEKHWAQFESQPQTWASLFQQIPSPADGNLFKPDNIQTIDEIPAGQKIQWIRAWDLASTTDGDWTAGPKLGRLADGRLLIADMVRIRVGPDDRDMAMLNTARRDGPHTIIGIPQDPGQAGKPIWEEEMILMGNGSLRRLADVSVGDFVIGKDGLPHSVSAVFVQGDLPTIRIKTESGREVIAAHDHPFLTPDGWVNAGDLLVNDTLALRSCPMINGVSSRSLEEFRLAGYFIGDGAVGRSLKAGKTGSCHAEFVCHDAAELEDFITCVESLGGVVVKRNRIGQYGTKGLQQWLRDTDIAGKTAYDKQVPAWVFGGSKEQVSHFLGAYFSCDGTISKHGDEVIYYSVSKKLLEEVQHLLLRIGISSTLKRKNGKYLDNRHESWLLRMRQQDDAYGRFARRVPLYNNSKRERLKTILASARFRRFDEDYLPDRVVSIEDSGALPCRCLTVDDASSFLVNDIVVHNTQIAYLTKMLSGFRVRCSPESGDKITRAEPFAAQVNVGNVLMLRASWNNALIDELRVFPNGTFDDQVDGLSRAYMELIGKSIMAISPTVLARASR